MASTFFIDNETVIKAAWLNDVNAVVYGGGGGGSGDVVIPIASLTQLGGVKAGGTGIAIDATTGVISNTIPAYTLPIAQSGTLGGMKPDGTTITVNPTTGVASAAAGGYTLPIATASVLGGVKVGSGLAINAGTGVLSATGGSSTAGRMVSVVDPPYNCPTDTVTNCNPAFNAIIAALPSGSEIYVPPGVYNVTPGTLTTGGKEFRWHVSGVKLFDGVTDISGLPGIRETFFNHGIAIGQDSAPPISSTMIIGRNANQSGGTVGFTNSTLRVDTTVTNPALQTFEWGICSVLNNNANAGENVAIYGQANRISGTGPNWAACFEMNDKTNTGNPPALQWGMEVDVFGNGGDANNARTGIFVIVSKSITSDAPCTAFAGIRIAGGSLDSSLTKEFGNLWIHGILVEAAAFSAFTANNFGGDFGFKDMNTKAVGLELQGTYTQAAIRMKANDFIAMSSDNSRTFGWYTAGGWVMKVSGSTPHIFLDNGNYAPAGIFLLNSSAHTAYSASAGGYALPASAQGYIKITVDGAPMRIPFYNA